MVARAWGVTYEGIEVSPIEVQVQVAPGLPCMNIVGLADKAVAESKERIKATFHSRALAFPSQRITVNLAPANMHKEGTHFDLAIFVALLAELKLIDAQQIEDYFILGELSLDGTIKPVPGVLPAAISANAHKKGIICPFLNGGEATWSGNTNILAPEDITQLINHFRQNQILSYPTATLLNDNLNSYPDLADIKGNFITKRALEVAAAGGHNLLMIGPPGSGKSMLAKRIPGILPPLTLEEMLETSIINSIAGLLDKKGLVKERPFRAPHSTASVASMVGGSKNAKPGEVTLAHHGVLFLDELPQFPSYVLDALRQPIEDGKVTISRVNRHVTYPARFQLIGAMNPCKCGNFGDSNYGCSKAPKCAEDYQSKISGPILDRFDIKVEVMSSNVFNNNDKPTFSKDVLQRVTKARLKQKKRYQELGFCLNAYAEGAILEERTYPEPEALEMLKSAVLKFHLSARGYSRVLRVARTVADLDEKQNIAVEHMAEALSFRLNKFKPT